MPVTFLYKIQIEKSLVYNQDVDISKVLVQLNLFIFSWEDL